MAIKTLGVMLDCSRNGVHTVDFIKRYVDIISKMGYNMLQLYTEDTMEVENEPYFGHMRGRYTPDEIKEIDAYCIQKGVELVPCIQTLAHYTTLFRWEEYFKVHDTADILLIDEERTYELLDNIFSTISKNFTSKRINIGMDEAHMVGLGRYLDKHGYVNRFELLLKHLNKVCEIAQKYGFKPMMWVDMFFNFAFKAYLLDEDVPDFSQDIIDKLPKNMQYIYWDYYSHNKERFDRAFKLTKQLGDTVYASGSWGWTGFIPHNEFGIDVLKYSMKSCEEYGVEEVFTTIWGDDGGETSRLSVLPTLMCKAEFARGNYDMDSIKEKFYNLFGVKYDDYMALDVCALFDDKTITEQNPDKWGLYNDCFLGLFDETDAVKYKADNFKTGKERLKKVDGGEFSSVFRLTEKFCEVMEYKFDLGAKTRKAYKEGNMFELKNLVENRYKPLIPLLEEFYDMFYTHWHTEYKSFGWEVSDLRLGGIIQRIKTCTRRLLDYIEGKETKIDELEQDALPPSKDTSRYLMHRHLRCVTAGSMWL